MQMRYFQAVADIYHHYEDILYRFSAEGGDIGLRLLDTWGIRPEDEADIREEYEAIRYLLDCRLEFSRDRDAHKPSVEVMNRCLRRHLRFLETIHRCHAYNVNQHRFKPVQKQYKACRHYLFKFSLPAWYTRLPDVIKAY